MTEFVVDVLYTTVFDHDNELVFTHTFTDEKNDYWFEQDFRSRDLFRDIQMVISDMIKMDLSGRCDFANSVFTVEDRGKKCGIGVWVALSNTGETVFGFAKTYKELLENIKFMTNGKFRIRKVYNKLN